MSLFKMFGAGIFMFLLVMFMLQPERTLDRVENRTGLWFDYLNASIARNPDRTQAVVIVFVLGFVIWYAVGQLKGGSK